jgi:hypothetical protein
MQLQLNVHRLVVATACRLSIRLIPAPSRCASSAGASAPRMQGGNLAGAMLRSPTIRAVVTSRPIATPLPAFDFLENEQQQLYWRADIVQMTRYYMLEASGIALSAQDGHASINFRVLSSAN